MLNEIDSNSFLDKIEKNIDKIALFSIPTIVAICFALAGILSLPVNEKFKDSPLIKEYEVQDWLTFWLSVISIVFTLILNVFVIRLTAKYREFDNKKENRLLINQWASVFNFRKLTVSEAPFGSTYEKAIFMNIEEIKNYQDVIKLTFSSLSDVPSHINITINNINISTRRFQFFINDDDDNVEPIKLENIENSWQSNGSIPIIQANEFDNISKGLKINSNKDFIIYRTYTREGCFRLSIYFFVHEGSGNGNLKNVLQDIVFVGKTPNHIANVEVNMNISLTSDALISPEQKKQIKNKKRCKNKKHNEHIEHIHYRLDSFAEVVYPTVAAPNPPFFEIYRSHFSNINQ